MFPNTTIGENYFGEDNCECLCQTCEDEGLNGWAQGEMGEDKALVPQLSIEEETGGGRTLRRRRARRESTISSRDESMTPEINIRPFVSKATPRSRSRFKNAESPLSATPSVEPSVSPLKRKRLEDLTPSPSKKSKKPRYKLPKKSEPSSLSISTSASTNPSPPSSTAGSRRVSASPSGTDNQTSTDATSVDEDTIIVEQPTPRIISPTVSRLRKTRARKQPLLEQAKMGEPILVGESTSMQHPVLQDDSASSSTLSDLASDIFQEEEEAFKNGSETKNTSGGNNRKRKVPEPASDDEDNEDDEPRPIRTRGDYVLTSRLLAEPQSAWITCKICEESFVQQNAYFTRSSCPRCERHSKLYGYQWPKTDKDGKHDTEERVLDHRTVHRFIQPKEEKAIRKKNRCTTESQVVSRDVSEVVQPEAIFEKVKAKAKPRKKRARSTM